MPSVAKDTAMLEMEWKQVLIGEEKEYVVQEFAVTLN
jgi:hypothetical protein